MPKITFCAIIVIPKVLTGEALTYLGMVCNVFPHKSEEIDQISYQVK